MATDTAHQIIVIAWAEKTKLVPTGLTVTRDRNLFPQFTTDWEGRAAIWLNRGTAVDVAKATTFAASDGHKVFTYPIDERDPLGRARAAAVAEAKADEAKQARAA